MQGMMNENLTLNEIQPLIAIDDHSLTYAVILLSLATFLVVVGVYFVYKYFISLKQKKKKLGNAYHLVEDIDLTDTRKAAYLLTTEGFRLLKTPQQKKIYEEMTFLLKEYKYTEHTKDVFDKQTLDFINKFLRAVK